MCRRFSLFAEEALAHTVIEGEVRAGGEMIGDAGWIGRHQRKGTRASSVGLGTAIEEKF